MKKTVYLALLLPLLLSGCSRNIYPDLPNQPYEFVMGEIVDEKDDDASYGTIEYNGRVYMGYGTLDGTLYKKDIQACIGYIVQDEQKNTDYRVYTLKDTDDYLMTYIENAFMEQPSFLRAIDTKKEEINTPSYIDSLEYTYWEE